VISKLAKYKEIMLWNYEFPRYLYTLCQQTGLKLITLGSVHENYPQLLSSNLYLQSKFKLKEFLVKKDFKDSLHFQFHTWYGGNKVHEQMFLGQIINSIRHRSVFKLNSGDQKREYHHIEDDAKCLLKTLLKRSVGCFEISHGQPVTLRDISNSIFSFFNCEDYLQIADSPILAEYDINYDVFKTSNCAFRPTIEGLINYVQTKI
jgi:nucleoside-diphosphate-sugar epimerase